MTLDRFLQMQDDLTARLAASMAKALRDMGDDIVLVEWVSHLPLRLQAGNDEAVR